MKSYINLFRNYANFKGFLKRGPFWTAIIIHRLIQCVALAPLVYSFINDSFVLPGYYFTWVLPLLFFYSLLMVIPVLSACVRRFHTLPRKGWWLLVGFIPVAGWFIVLIWLLQKGSYEEFERRLQRSSSPLSGVLLASAEKPRMGGWFFPVFLLLAAGGFLLNRQIMKAGSYPAAFEGIRASLPESISAAVFRGWDEEMAKKTETVSVASVKEPDAEQTAEAADATEEPKAIPEPTEIPTPTPIPAVHLQAAEGSPLVSLRGEIEILPVGDELYVSKYAVSMGNYRECVRDEACEMPAELNTLAYRGMVPADGGVREDAVSLPMVFVTRDQAAAFCAWAGMRLPTEDEWKAAAEIAPTDYSAENANLAGADRSAYITSEDQLALTVPVTAFADTLPDSAPVQMIGNVWEWTAAEGNAKTALALGGAWNSYPKMLQEDDELITLSGYSADNIGFRCFADAEDVTEEYFTGGEPVPAAAAEETGEDIPGIDAEEIPAAEAEEIEAEEIEAEEAVAEEAAVEVPSENGKSVGSIDLDAGSTSKKSAAPIPEEADTMTDDGMGLIRPQDNARMVLIPAGTFSMGVTGGAVDEKPVHEVALSAYWIDAYEVTNAQYALCVAEGVCSEPHETKSFRRASYYGDPEFDNYPVIYVDWQQASDYCAWTGSRLPTEAQWEYAAKGPEDVRYPWGNVFDSAKLNYSGNGNYDTLAVDANPDDVSFFGIYNLGGNVSEWVFDRYQESWYSNTNQPEDPTGPENGQYRVIRGGSAQTGENNARTADRFYALENSFNLDRGFRCARPD